jgi:hypothetical protein
MRGIVLATVSHIVGCRETYQVSLPLAATRRRQGVVSQQKGTSNGFFRDTCREDFIRNGVGPVRASVK